MILNDAAGTTVLAQAEHTAVSVCLPTISIAFVANLADPATLHNFRKLNPIDARIGVAGFGEIAPSGLKSYLAGLIQHVCK